MPSTLAREACHQPEPNVSRRTRRENGLSRGIGVRVGLLFAALFVIAIFVWQGIAAHGAPDPLQAHTTATVASSAGARTSHAHTAAPSWASATAMARPMPCAAPVTIAVRPARRTARAARGGAGRGRRGGRRR